MNVIAPDRIYAQYRTKPKALAWYNITPEIGLQIFNTAKQVRDTYIIDEAEGVQLNIIGNIVVLSRVQKTSQEFGIYQLGDEAAECGFDEVQCGQGSGGNYYTVALTDAQYRYVIRSKIVKNTGTSTIDDTIRGLNFILTTPATLTVVDYEDMSFEIVSDTALSQLEKDLINYSNLIPKPQGVRFRGLVEIV
jgi:hypothetical protein